MLTRWKWEISGRSESPTAEGPEGEPKSHCLKVDDENLLIFFLSTRARTRGTVLYSEGSFARISPRVGPKREFRYRHISHSACTEYEPPGIGTQKGAAIPVVLIKRVQGDS
jgi:hypothetical protein